jgi:hypothetical protein
LNLIPDDLLLVSAHVNLPILEHRDGHAAVARLEDARLGGEVLRPAVLDVGRGFVDVDVYAREDEGEVGELRAGRGVRVGEVDVLHTRRVHLVNSRGYRREEGAHIPERCRQGGRVSTR